MPKRKPDTQKQLLVALLDAQRQKLVAVEDEELAEDTKPIPQELVAKVQSSRKKKR